MDAHFSKANLATHLVTLMQRHYLLNVTLKVGKGKENPLFVLHTGEPLNVDEHINVVTVVGTQSTSQNGTATKPSCDGAFQHQMDQVVNQYMTSQLSALTSPPYLKVTALIYNLKDEQGNILNTRYGLVLAVLHTIGDLQV